MEIYSEKAGYMDPWDSRNVFSFPDPSELQVIKSI